MSTRNRVPAARRRDPHRGLTRRLYSAVERKPSPKFLSSPARLRKRLIQGRFESGEDIAALRSFVGLTQAEFARAIEISVHTLRNWEQGRRKGLRSYFCESLRGTRGSFARIWSPRHSTVLDTCWIHPVQDTLQLPGSVRRGGRAVEGSGLESRLTAWPIFYAISATSCAKSRSIA